jgi:cytochrome P450
VSHFLRENQQQNGKPEMTEAELKIASSILMTAGSDTNATLLCGCLYYVLNDEQVWSRLATEVRTEYPREADITFASLQTLPYLNAVIEEALRIYPVVPSTFPRRTPALGATIVGQFVPADYAIGINGYAASRSATNFTLPDKFCPERWLGDPRFQRDEKKAHQPFSTGPRNCLGKNMAWAFARCKY